jgi:hypothetical protein
MKQKTTEPKVFIIESLEFDDEEKGRYEGSILSDILRLSGIQTQYFYIRTSKELNEVLDIFQKSGYRYLHISCHGGENSIWTTLDEITYDELGLILKGKLEKKRLFLSACSVVNKDLAKEVIPRTKCYSIIGPARDIAFNDAAIMWASFYHLMFKENSTSMIREGLLKNLQKVVDTFGEPLNYFSISKSRGFKQNSIKSISREWNKLTEEDIIK